MTVFDHLEDAGDRIELWLLDYESERLCRFPMTLEEAQRLRDELTKLLAADPTPAKEGA